MAATETTDEPSPADGGEQASASGGRGPRRRAVPPPYTWEELERRCQDPHPSASPGLFMLLVVRPAAMHVAWRLAVAGVPPAAVSGAGLFAAALGSVLCSTGWGWLPGLVLLECWLVLEYAEVLLRRCQRVHSLDVDATAKLVRRLVCVMAPMGIGYAFFDPKTDAFLGVLLGWIWGLSLLAVNAQDDVRARAYMQRLSRLRGDLRVCGPPPPPPPRGLPLDPTAAVRWMVRKSCEPHVWLNLVVLGTLFISWIPVVGTGGVFVLVAYLSLAAFCTAVYQTLAAIRDHQADDEFAQWFPPPEGCELSEDGGWWYVRRESPFDPPPRRAAPGPGPDDAPFEADVVDPPRR